MPFGQQMIANNRRWAASRLAADPDYFTRFAEVQAPRVLWIGCADSRVPVSEILGMGPGEVFVHRNIANLVNAMDINGQAAIEFAVSHLKVADIVVCGHYGCGGVRHALGPATFSVIDQWLQGLKEVYQRHQDALLRLAAETDRLDRLCELNVHQQVINVCRTTAVQRAWAEGRRLTVHGWIYDLRSGHVHDLKFSVRGPEGVEPVYRLQALGLQALGLQALGAGTDKAPHAD